MSMSVSLVDGVSNEVAFERKVGLVGIVSQVESEPRFAEYEVIRIRRVVDDPRATGRFDVAVNLNGQLLVFAPIVVPVVLRRRGQ